MKLELSPRMIDALEFYAWRDTYTHHIQGDAGYYGYPQASRYWPNTNTIAALVLRDLITYGTDHNLTDKGREEAVSLFEEYRTWYFSAEQIKRRLEQDEDDRKERRLKRDAQLDRLNDQFERYQLDVE